MSRIGKYNRDKKLYSGCIGLGQVGECEVTVHGFTVFGSGEYKNVLKLDCGSGSHTVEYTKKHIEFYTLKMGEFYVMYYISIKLFKNKTNRCDHNC